MGDKMDEAEKAKLLLLGHNYSLLLGRVIGLLNDLDDNCNIPEELQVRIGGIEADIDDVFDGDFKDANTYSVASFDISNNTHGYRLEVFSNGAIGVFNDQGGRDISKEEIQVYLKE